MRARQEQLLLMLRTAFATAHPPAPPGGRAPDTFGTQMQALSDTIDRIDRHSTDQQAGARLSRQETGRQAALRGQLRTKHMQPIARVARAVLKEAQGIERTLYTPSPRTRAVELIGAANAMAEAATPYSDVFTSAGRPADFITQLKNTTQAFEQSLVGQRGMRGRRSTATATLPADLARGRAAVTLLDAVVRPYFAETDEELLNGWIDAKRVRRFSVSGNVSGGRANAGTTNTGTTAAPDADAGASGAGSGSSAAGTTSTV